MVVWTKFSETAAHKVPSGIVTGPERFLSHSKILPKIFEIVIFRKPRSSSNFRTVSCLFLYILSAFNIVGGFLNHSFCPCYRNSWTNFTIILKIFETVVFRNPISFSNYCTLSAAYFCTLHHTLNIIEALPENKFLSTDTHSSEDFVTQFYLGVLTHWIILESFFCWCQVLAKIWYWFTD